MEYRAALLASHGYVAMALSYLDSGDMRPSERKFSYFEVCAGYYLMFCTSSNFLYNKIKNGS